jgi:hypothetical protein
MWNFHAQSACPKLCHSYVRSVLLVEETGVPGENHVQTLSHNVVSSTPPHEWDTNECQRFVV